MKEDLREKLLKKGWDPEEIEYTFSVMEKGEDKKSYKLFEQVVYWLSIIIAIIGNMVVSVVLIPFFLVLHAFFLYFIVIMLGIGFGFLYDILIWDIKKVTGREMIIESVFIPALALITVAFMTYFGNLIARSWALNTIHNPLLVGLVYAMAFVAPWVIREYVLEKGF